MISILYKKNAKNIKIWYKLCVFHTFLYKKIQKNIIICYRLCDFHIKDIWKFKLNFNKSKPIKFSKRES